METQRIGSTIPVHELKIGTGPTANGPVCSPSHTTVICI